MNEESLSKALRSGYYNKKMEAIKQIAAERYPESEFPFRDLLRDTTDIHEIYVCLQRISDFGDDAYIEIVRQKAMDPNPDIRGSALDALSHQNVTSSPEIMDALYAWEPDVRETAAHAAARLNLREAIPRIQELLNDDQFHVRSAAKGALQVFNWMKSRGFG